jgi:hypothetical protein
MSTTTADHPRPCLRKQVSPKPLPLAESPIGRDREGAIHTGWRAESHALLTLSPTFMSSSESAVEYDVFSDFFHRPAKQNCKA